MGCAMGRVGLYAPDGGRKKNEAVEVDERLAAVHVGEIPPEDSSCGAWMGRGEISVESLGDLSCAEALRDWQFETHQKRIPSRLSIKVLPCRRLSFPILFEAWLCIRCSTV